jgi:hypothetical protein
MSGRVELERSVILAGEPVQLFASCGSQDDYVELVLPESPELEARTRRRLTLLHEGTTAELLDVRFSDDRPTTVSILALYAGAAFSDWRSRPYPDRLAGVLAHLAAVEPGFDFGELLPVGPLAVKAAPVAEPLCPAAVADPVAETSAASGPVDELAAARAVPRVDAVPTADHRDSSRSRSAVDYLGRAGELAARGRVHKALRAVEDALRQNSADREAWALREELQLLERRERRRQREPKNAQAQLEVGFSYLTFGSDGEAIAALREAARLDSNFYLAHLILGIALHHGKRVREAQVCYERAARLRPLEEAPRELLRSLRRGLPPFRPVEDRPWLKARLSEFGFGKQVAAAG